MDKQKTKIDENFILNLYQIQKDTAYQITKKRAELEAVKKINEFKLEIEKLHSNYYIEKRKLFKYTDDIAKKNQKQLKLWYLN